MKNCKTCQYWQIKKDPYDSNIPVIGTCSITIPFYDALERIDCEYIEDDEAVGFADYKIKEEHIKKLAFVQDGDCYAAVLYTLPDFGCVQHKDKE
jgi:hypothetical protein